MSPFSPIEHRVLIAAPRSKVWRALTEPDRMAGWMGEPAMNLEVETEWKVGGAFEIRGFHHAQFVNRGRVLCFEPESRVSYSHLSSVSRLADVPENHSVIDFRLGDAEGGGTSVALTVSGFPTESIYRHLAFYWRGTLGVLAARVAGRA